MLEREADFDRLAVLNPWRSWLGCGGKCSSGGKPCSQPFMEMLSGYQSNQHMVGGMERCSPRGSFQVCLEEVRQERPRLALNTASLIPSCHGERTELRLGYVLATSRTCWCKLGQINYLLLTPVFSLIHMHIAILLEGRLRH